MLEYKEVEGQTVSGQEMVLVVQCGDGTPGQYFAVGGGCESGSGLTMSLKDASLNGPDAYRCIWDSVGSTGATVKAKVACLKANAN